MGRSRDSALLRLRNTAAEFISIDLNLTIPTPSVQYYFVRTIQPTLHEIYDSDIKTERITDVQAPHHQSEVNNHDRCQHDARRDLQKLRVGIPRINRNSERACLPYFKVTIGYSSMRQGQLATAPTGPVRAKENFDRATCVLARRDKWLESRQLGSKLALVSQR